MVKLNNLLEWGQCLRSGRCFRNAGKNDEVENVYYTVFTDVGTRI